MIQKLIRTTALETSPTSMSLNASTFPVPNPSLMQSTLSSSLIVLKASSYGSPQPFLLPPAMPSVLKIFHNSNTGCVMLRLWAPCMISDVFVDWSGLPQQRPNPIFPIPRAWELKVYLVGSRLSRPEPFQCTGLHGIWLWAWPQMRSLATGRTPYLSSRMMISMDLGTTNPSIPSLVMFSSGSGPRLNLELPLRTWIPTTPISMLLSRLSGARLKNEPNVTRKRWSL